MSEDRHIAFSVSAGCYPYQMGVAYYIQQNFDLSNVTYSGASGGGWPAFLLAVGIDVKVALGYLLKFAPPCAHGRLVGAYGVYDRGMRAVFNAMFKETDAHIKVSNRLSLSLTRIAWFLMVPYLKEEIITEFTDNDDIISCIIASALIPFALTGRPTAYYRGWICVDGGLTNAAGVRRFHDVMVDATCVGAVEDGSGSVTPNAVVAEPNEPTSLYSGICGKLSSTLGLLNKPAMAIPATFTTKLTAKLPPTKEPYGVLRLSGITVSAMTQSAASLLWSSLVSSSLTGSNSYSSLYSYDTEDEEGESGMDEEAHLARKRSMHSHENRQAKYRPRVLKDASGNITYPFPSATDAVKSILTDVKSTVSTVAGRIANQMSSSRGGDSIMPDYDSESEVAVNEIPITHVEHNGRFLSVVDAKKGDGVGWPDSPDFIPPSSNSTSPPSMMSDIINILPVIMPSAVVNVVDGISNTISNLFPPRPSCKSSSSGTLAARDRGDPSALKELNGSCSDSDCWSVGDLMSSTPCVRTHTDGSELLHMSDDEFDYIEGDGLDLSKIGSETSEGLSVDETDNIMAMLNGDVSISCDLAYNNEFPMATSSASDPDVTMDLNNIQPNLPVLNSSTLNNKDTNAVAAPQSSVMDGIPTTEYPKARFNNVQMDKPPPTGADKVLEFDKTMYWTKKAQLISRTSSGGRVLEIAPWTWRHHPLVHYHLTADRDQVQMLFDLGVHDAQHHHKDLQAFFTTMSSAI